MCVCVCVAWQCKTHLDCRARCRLWPIGDGKHMAQGRDLDVPLHQEASDDRNMHDQSGPADGVPAVFRSEMDFSFEQGSTPIEV